MIETQTPIIVIERPMGFENETRDCSVRALSLASNKPYVLIHETLKKYGRKNRHGTRVKNILCACKELNLVMHQVKRSGSVGGFLKKFPNGNYLCARRGHFFAVIDGVAHDQDNMNCHIQGAWKIGRLIK